MGIFNRKALVEQLDLESLRPDSEVVTEIDKKLSAMEDNYSKYYAKLTEIAQQKAEISQEITPADSSSSFDDVLKKLTDFFSFRKSAKTVEQLEVEANFLQEWYKASTIAGLKDIYPQLDKALKTAKETMEQLENEYETAGNTSELDDLLPVVTGNLLELLNRFKALARTLKRDNGQPVDPDGSHTIKINGQTVHASFYTASSIPARTSLADKQAATAEKARADALYAKRMQEFWAQGNN